MCINNLKVRNSKQEDSRFNPIVDRFYNYVPCGKCQECLDMIVDSYRVRSIFHYDNCVKNGGRCFYYTLTYNDDNLPKYENVPCFDSRLVQLFLKRLRKYLPSKSLSYIITSEYGDRTLRPHHHALFFVNYKINSSFFRYLISKSWTYGFNKPGKYNGVVKNIDALNYVAKYISKDKDYSEFIRRFGKDADFFQKFEEYKFITKDTRCFRNVHYQSIGFGSSMCNYISDTDLLRGYFLTNNKDGLNKKFTIPLYIVRKLLYKTSKNDKGNIVYDLNSRGLIISKLKLKSRINKMTEEFSSLFENSRYHFDLISNKFKDFNEWESFVFTTLHGDTSFQDLSAFYCFYHDLPYGNFRYGNLKRDLDNYFNQIEFNKDLPFIPYVDIIYNDCMDYFIGYEQLIKYLFKIKKYLQYEIYRNRNFAYNTTQYFRSSISKVPPKLDKTKSFSQFINYKNSRLCLTMSRNKKLG